MIYIYTFIPSFNEIISLPFFILFCGAYFSPLFDYLLSFMVCMCSYHMSCVEYSIRFVLVNTLPLFLHISWFRTPSILVIRNDHFDSVVLRHFLVFVTICLNNIHNRFIYSEFLCIVSYFCTITEN